jgi:energy-coupling factor transporter ATP-binding protein EcfA2
MRGLQSIRIQRFKRIDDAPVALSDVNVLVGANNSGKSSLIQALHFGIGLLQTIRLNHNWGDVTELSTSLSPQQLIYCPSEDVYAIGPRGRLREELTQAVVLTYTLLSGEVTTVSMRKGRNRNIVVAVTNARVAKELSSLELPYSVFSPGLAGISKKEAYVSDGVLLRTLARGDANLVLRNILLRLWQTEGWQKLIDDLHFVFPGVELNVDFNLGTDEVISVDVRLPETQNSWVPLEIAGTGLLQAIQILSYIHRFNPAIIVLDEPDSHLHPNNQRLLCALLRKVADEQEIQVILTTHSRHVVDSIGSSSGFLWVRSGKIDAATPDDEVGILMEIGALDIKERASNPNTRALILTEDEITGPIEAVLAASGLNMGQTIVLPYYGVSQTRQLRPLVRVIQEQNPTVKILLHRDRDFLENDEVASWLTEVRSLGIEPFLTVGRDIESQLFKADYLASVNRVTQPVMQSIIDAALTESAERRFRDYVNGRIDTMRKKGQTPNPGQISADGIAIVNASPLRFSGKAEMKIVKRIFRERLARNMVVVAPSPLLKDDEIWAFATRVFGMTATA